MKTPQEFNIGNVVLYRNTATNRLEIMEVRGVLRDRLLIGHLDDNSETHIRYEDIILPEEECTTEEALRNTFKKTSVIIKSIGDRVRKDLGDLEYSLFRYERHFAYPELKKYEVYYGNC